MSTLDRVVTVDGLDYRVTSSPGGAPPGRAFVLVHGIGMSRRSQSRLHDRLSGTGKVYSVEVPGFGGHRRPARDVPVDVMASGLGSALGELGIGEGILVGHSMGAQWVVELGVMHPELVAGVVAIGPVADDTSRGALGQLWGLTLDGFVEPPQVNRLVVADYLRTNPTWYLRQLEHMLTYPIEKRVAELHMPFLVIRGGKDPIARTDWCRRLRAHAAVGSMVVVPAGAHNVQLTAATAVSSAIHAFASTLPTGTG